MRGSFLLHKTVFAFLLCFFSARVCVADAFGDYWYQGKAEISRYQLEQVRYGHVHLGDAVLIFVTEDFLPDKQVKFEDGDDGIVRVPVLKCNATRKFLTGIYPYSLMTSVFSPVDVDRYPTWKVSFSGQEWCGHTYMQLNFHNESYKARLHSYFQEEADQSATIPKAFLEDSVWTMIRLRPSLLPQGNVAFVPGLHDLRLHHRPMTSYEAEAHMEDIDVYALTGQPALRYRVSYVELPRTLEIIFAKKFPYEILAWEEQHVPNGGPDQTRTTRAIRTHMILSDYWAQRGPSGRLLRKDLGLSQEY